MAVRQSSKITRICQHCNKSFTPIKKTGKFCSTQCAHASTIKAVHRPCAYCNKLFPVAPSVQATKRFCSAKCYGLARRKRVLRHCKNCNQPFETCQSYANKGRGIFCSDACFRAYPALSRLMEKISIDPVTECWVWQGVKTHGGYGQIVDDDGNCVMTHRLVFEMANGALGNRLACHKCDNPSCCNPDHIFPGTHLDNTRDMIQKGRQRFTGRPPQAKKTA